jgi:hypothetical protein
MAAKLIRLRYAGSCARCGVGLPVGAQAWWDREAHTTTCLACRPHGPDRSADVTPIEPPPLAVGEAGASARLEYEKRHARREHRIEERWGGLAGIVRFLSDDPQSTRAWATGSAGEQLLAERLLRGVGDRAVLLHDRKVPGTRGNIDHLAVAASGVWVIDAKSYRGLVERRDIGGWFRTDYRLYVGGRDRTNLAQGLGWQIEAVGRALSDPEVPINAALCFIEAEWRMFSKPFVQDGVWVTWAKKLAEMIAAPGPLERDVVLRIAGRLAIALPPAARTLVDP